MTLTKEALLEKCKSRFEWVEVAGFGKVGLRDQTEVKRAFRVSRQFDKNGNFVESARELRRIHMIVDQVMSNESEPMFASDAEAISSRS